MVDDLDQCWVSDFQFQWLIIGSVSNCGYMSVQMMNFCGKGSSQLSRFWSSGCGMTTSSIRVDLSEVIVHFNKAVDFYFFIPSLISFKTLLTL
jgi:hypothetical protein